MSQKTVLKKLQIRAFEVTIFTDRTGMVEHDTRGEMGGLWFNEAKELIDYDGMAMLPGAVVDAIVELGYTVTEDMK